MKNDTGYKKFICELGPGDGYPGGMLTVINSYMDSKYLNDLPLKHIPTASKKNKLIVFIRSYFSYLSLCKRHKIAVTHIHMSERGSCIRTSIFIELSKKYNVPVLIHSHGGEFIEYFENLSVADKNKLIKSFNYADNIIVLTHGWKKYWEKIVDSKKIVVIPNFVSCPDDFQKIYHANGKLNLLFLGYVSENKGVYDLIKSIKYIVENYTSSISLKIAGNGEIEKCSSFIKDLNMENFISVIGWVDYSKKDKLLREADLLVLPSHYESFGIVALEAMSYRLPVVCGDKGFTKEIVEDGINGYVAITGNYVDISKKILLADSNIEKMGSNARLATQNKYSEKNIVNMVRSIYLKYL